MTIDELYSHEAQLLGLKEMMMMELQPFMNREVTPARLAALRIAAQNVIEKLHQQDQGNLTQELIDGFEAMVADEVGKIFSPKEN
jgi:hypothetical protein